MKIVSWNLNKAAANRIKSWEYLCDLNPDIALLQEVNSIPDFVTEVFNFSYRKSTNKNRNPQKFGTTILVKGRIANSIQLESRSNWINEQLNHFPGIFIGAQIVLKNGFQANVVSVHSPAWHFDSAELDENEKSEIKLKNNSKIWGTELLWSALANIISRTDLPWIIGGDFNSSPTFDHMWKGGPHGNQEVLDRMNALELTECLFYSEGKLTPTFKNPSDRKIIHQIDHLFVSSRLIKTLKNCTVEKAENIFDNKLSDHLPIIADFNL